MYCQRTVPELHNAVGNSSYESVYYLDKLDSNNKDYIDELGVFADPTILFYSNGELFETSIGFKNQEYFESILIELNKSTT